VTFFSEEIWYKPNRENFTFMMGFDVLLNKNDGLQAFEKVNLSNHG
jgi:hypothetical protein